MNLFLAAWLAITDSFPLFLALSILVGLMVALLRERGIVRRQRFCLPESQRTLPQCRVRLFTEADAAACLEIYRQHETVHFPGGHLDKFQEWLGDGRNFILICEVAGEIRGFGGIGLIRQKGEDQATLTFGMVHPRYQRQGYGTVLLLSRLAALPEPAREYVVVLTTAGTSETYYPRFGFCHVARRTVERGLELDIHIMRLLKDDWQKCRDTLALAGISSLDL